MSDNLPPYDFKTKEYKRYVHAVLSGQDFTVELHAAATASVRYVHDDQSPKPLRTRPSGWLADLPAGWSR